MSRSGAPYLNQDVSVFDWLATEQSSSMVSPTFADRDWTGNEEIGTAGLQEKEWKSVSKIIFPFWASWGGILACL